VPTAPETEEGLVNELLMTETPRTRRALEALSRRVAADLQVKRRPGQRDQWGYVGAGARRPAQDTSAVAKLVEEIVEREKGPLKAYYIGAPFFTTRSQEVLAQLPGIVPAFALLLVAVLVLGVRRPGVIALSSWPRACRWSGGWGWCACSAGPVADLGGAALPLLVVLAVVAYARGLQVRLTSRKPTRTRSVSGGGRPGGAGAGEPGAEPGRPSSTCPIRGGRGRGGSWPSRSSGCWRSPPASTLLAQAPVVHAPPRRHLKTNAGLAVAVAALLAFGYVPPARGS
jgi:MYXO-CTERM domain-containing protein